MVGKYVPLTLEATARRIKALGSEDAWICVRDFLDDWYAADQITREKMLLDKPPETGDQKLDAYLAALAEYFAGHHGLAVPDWVYDSNRFLNQFWFPTSCQSLHALALVQSPAAFRRRGIFIDSTEFLRC